MKLYYEVGVERDKPFIERDVTSNVQQVGYVDVEAQVKRMLLAGENLREYHRKAYDFPESDFDLDDVRPDPTLDVGFDPADATFFARRVEEKIKAARKRASSEKQKDPDKDDNKEVSE